MNSKYNSIKECLTFSRHRLLTKPTLSQHILLVFLKEKKYPLCVQSKYKRLHRPCSHSVPVGG